MTDEAQGSSDGAGGLPAGAAPSAGADASAAAPARHGWVLAGIAAFAVVVLVLTVVLPRVQRGDRERSLERADAALRAALVSRDLAAAKELACGQVFAELQLYTVVRQGGASMFSVPPGADVSSVTQIIKADLKWRSFTFSGDTASGLAAIVGGLTVPAGTEVSRSFQKVDGHWRVCTATFQSTLSQ